jgi:hypothetical protein
MFSGSTSAMHCKTTIIMMAAVAVFYTNTQRLDEVIFSTVPSVAWRLLPGVGEHGVLRFTLYGNWAVATDDIEPTV